MGDADRGAGKAAEGTSKLRRPYERKAFREQVEAAAPKTADGRFVDPNTGLPIEGKFHYGHEYGREHRRLVKEAEERGMTQAGFNDWVNSHPDWFQIEDPASKLSRRFEKPGSD